MRRINKIIIHCSASEFGDGAEIDRWHKERGWDGCGYHYVLLNGRRTAGRPYRKEDDGLIETARSLEKEGIHCAGENHDSIGICLVGNAHFTANQLYEALPNLLRALMWQFVLTSNSVYGHYEFNRDKACPNIEGGLLRRMIR